MSTLHGNKRRKKTPTLYILPNKIQKYRLTILQKSAVKLGFDVAGRFSATVTHVLCNDMENWNVAVDALKADKDVWCDDIHILHLQWLHDCQRAGKEVDIEMRHKLQRKVNAEETKEKQVEIAEYACQRITPLKHFNEKFTKALEILEEDAGYHDSDESYSRALAFRRGSCVLKSLSFTVTSMTQISKLRDLGQHCRKVINEILEDGFSSEVEKIEHSDWFQKMRLFTSVFGVGPTTASKWISQDIGTIQDAQNSVQRRDDTRIDVGLQFHEDLMARVSCHEAEAIKCLMKEEAEEILPGVVIELTGGFRRGKNDGHDVDLLFTHPQEGQESGFLEKILRRLRKRDLIVWGRHERSTYTPTVLHSDTKGAYLRSTLDHFEKWYGIIKVPLAVHQGTEDSYANYGHDANIQTEDSLECVNDLQKPIEMENRDWIARRVDLILAPFSQYYYALVGWTGSKHFNRSLRLYAQRQLNMKLTSHGLYDITKRCPIRASSEKEVFDVLKLPYHEPRERNC